jgi:hypothetical protein
MTLSRAETLVAEYFSSTWNGVVDGCGFFCAGCGTKDARRLAIGYAVEIEYACEMLATDSPEFHLFETAYVSPFGTVHGVRTPGSRTR